MSETRNQPTPKQRINKLPYDGVAGNLHHWVPGTLKNEFEAAQTYLFSKYTYEEIKSGFDDLLKAFGDKRKRIDERGEPEEGVALRRDAARHLESLAYVYSLVKLGRDGCYKALLGKGGQNVYRGIALSEAGKMAQGKKRKTRKPPYHLLLEKLKPKNWDSLLTILKEDYQARNGYLEEGTIYKLSKSAKIRVYEINGEIKSIQFCGLDGKIMDPVTFKTLQNLIPKYRAK